MGESGMLSIEQVLDNMDDSKNEKRVQVRIHARHGEDGKTFTAILEYGDPPILVWETYGPTLEFVLLDLAETMTVYYLEATEELEEADNLIEMALGAFENNNAINWDDLQRFLKKRGHR